MSTEFFARILGMIVFAVIGWLVGARLGELGIGPETLTAVVIGLVGALIGLVLTPFATTRPVRVIRSRVGEASSRTFFSGMIGLMVGLVVAALLSYPLSLIPSPFGDYLPILAAFVLAYLGVMIFSTRQEDVLRFVPTKAAAPVLETGNGSAPLKADHGLMILLDTSVIIDGRIEDIARTGFLPGKLLIPHFVLNELQYIADSADAMRRQRGRRGLDVLAALQKEPVVEVVIEDIDIEEASAVDDKLLVLARRMGSPILTNDYNLNRVADLQGVRILNINELANAVKAVLLPGEPLEVEIIQEGKEHGQGVGYLDDGTMIVVENGGLYLGRSIRTVVTKVLQTAAGRMIFARPSDE
ncbi:MAG TPA: PIN domain-containing protein [Anaerolineales bacterium]|nr:PIN domain-containing protein [Anaerolineales bacterium]